ncbi:3-phosphoserine/phosphohydroxythreonine transaminase [Portibacter lacus]|uniref:Phosphoserine aminotransferase n=1 Tax=Portibacter lacus TaxID=1099794 RepID=A0AA37SQV2_9BACT|nr:3-phosphoserine/phosphohydroxythreonine transaminase [Portibacter lacus]GLR18953.1 phosphoserine aminotransferase [Portibacter lacus]
MKKINFYAGPAILAQEVIEEASKSALSFGDMGLSILEISHRSKEFVSVLEEAEALVRELLNVSDEYGVLFLSGGASSQFYMTAMNLLNEGDKAGYLDTGAWSSKAIKEAKLFGEIEVVASSKDKNYNYIPTGYDIPSDYKYLHLTSNNTIFGTEIFNWPETDVPFVADMSSDIFSRPLDISKFSIIYAGAQKNLGPSGVTLVIVKKDILNKVEKALPTMLKYQTHIDKDSSFNTPPVYPIYVSMLTLRWIKKNGGVAAMEKKNIEKSDLLYNEIDRNSLFEGTAAKEDRSRMNVCFLLKDEALEAEFLKDCAAAGCVGVKGHRSVGGFRASIYNAMPKAGVQTLVDVMKKFEEKNT